MCELFVVKIFRNWGCKAWIHDKFFRLARSTYHAFPLPRHHKAGMRDMYLATFGAPGSVVLEQSETAAGEEPKIEVQKLETVKAAFCRLVENELAAALMAGRRLRFPTPTRPKLTVVVVVYNAPALTYLCLESVCREAGPSTEVVVIDNASGIHTRRVLDMLEGARVVRNESNLHFLEAVNAVLPRLSGEYILLLNNDLYLLPGALQRAQKTLTEDYSTGAVGAQVMGVDGRVLEAGCSILSRGECEGLSRRDDPTFDEGAAPRAVDYVSGCFLMTPRVRLVENGGFDRRYAPAYYEDVDYCTNLWERGWQVLCEPRAMVVHYESAGSSRYEVAKLVLRNRRRFRLKHKWRAAHQARHASMSVPRD